MPGSRAATCPACQRTYDKRSAHRCPAAPQAEAAPGAYPLAGIPHGDNCPHPAPGRGQCDRCAQARAVNERRIVIFDHTPGAGPWPGTCSVRGCQNMIITGDPEPLCNEHYCNRWRGTRRRGQGGAR